MAWRIHDSVIRGEVDNREKGIVRGRLWLDGLSDPVLLELRGNAHADLAGCHLRFDNPGATVPMRADACFSTLQQGTIGDLTASRKVRVPDVPIEEFIRWPKEKGPPPEHLANCLYLEWFSEANGRVVIESTDFRLDISAPEWRLTAEDEAQRAQEAQAGWSGFVQQLDAAVEQQRSDPDEDEEWDEHDYEKFLKESDARTDKYLELLEKYHDHPDREEIIAKEMGWGLDEDQENGDDGPFTVDEINRITEEAMNEPAPEPDPLTEGKDWIRTADGDLRHPLQHRCFENAMKYWHACKELGLENSEDPDLRQFLFEFQTTSAKLAGALAGIAQGRYRRAGAFTVAYLKRALDHLHKAQAGLEGIAPRHLLPGPLVASARQELFKIREGILQLMQEFRGQ